MDESTVYWVLVFAMDVIHQRGNVTVAVMGYCLSADVATKVKNNNNNNESTQILTTATDGFLELHEPSNFTVEEVACSGGGAPAASAPVAPPGRGGTGSS